MNQKFASKAVDENVDGLMFSKFCRWEMEVCLGWLSLTQRHLDWLTQSLC